MAYDILHADNSSGSFPSEDFSLLHEVEECAIPNGDSNHVNYNFTNMHSALNETAHDSNAEISSQLTKLISDNLSLKEALDKNNSMMKEQLSTIPAWRDLMIMKTEQQQRNIQEAKEKIFCLENENATLLKKLDNLMEEINKNKEIKDFCTKCETLETTLNSLFDEKDFIEKDKGILCCEMKNFHANLEQNLVAVCLQLDSMLNSKMGDKEKNLLKTFIRFLKIKIASLKGTFCASGQIDEEISYVTVQLQEEEEFVKEGSSLLNFEVSKKYEDLKESMKEKDKELDLVNEAKKQLSEKLKIYDLKIQELEMGLKAQFEHLSKKLNFESSVSEKYKERCEILQQQIEEYHEKLDKAKMSDDHNTQELHQEIQNLQEILKMEQRANRKDKEELSRVMIKCEELQVDFDRVTKLLEVVSRDEKEKIDKLQSLNEGNEKSYQEKMDHLTAQLFEVQEQLNESNAIVKEIKDKYTSLEEESEIIPVLKAQIEVYKRDFMRTVDARDAAQNEVERLNQELKKYNEKSDSSSRKSSPSSSKRTISFGSKRKEGKYTDDCIDCPICKKVFSTWDAVQTHVIQCIEK